MLGKKKLPYIQFFASDWLNDHGLRLVSYEAKGFWMDLLCLMAETSERGFLVNSRGVPYSRATVAAMLGKDGATVECLFDELAEHDVFSVDDRGAIYSRRIVRDEVERQHREENGSKGGRPRKTKTEAENQQGAEEENHPVTENENQVVSEKTNRNPGSGSGYSSSTLTNTDTAEECREGAAPGPRLVRPTLAGDEGFDEFYIRYCQETGKPVTGQDREDALLHWRTMSFASKVEAVRYIAKYAIDYRPDNPRKYKTPRNYLKAEPWTEVSLKPAVKEPKGVRLEDIA